jgi:hypothetical protein
VITLEQAQARLEAWMTPERLAWLDSLTDDDIAAQIASNPDAAPELTEEWFAKARNGDGRKGRRGG